MIAAAKKMAILMARLSELVRLDCKSSKRELIATAKALAEAGEEVRTSIFPSEGHIQSLFILGNKIG